MSNQTIFLVIITALAIVGISLYFCSCNKSRGAQNVQAITTTDPEFAALWQNFIEHDVKPHNMLNNKTRYMVLLAAHIAAQSVNEYKLILNEALDNGLTPVEVKEIVYQAVPYVGMAKVYDFFSAANEVLSARGVKLPLENQATTTPSTRFDKGLATQIKLFGEKITEMRENTPKEQAHINDFLAANCFGDYYTRGGIDLQTRELLTFALLISLGGVDAQARAHAKANLDAGNDKETLIAVVTQLLPYIGYPRSLNAIAAINDVAHSK